MKGNFRLRVFGIGHRFDGTRQQLADRRGLSWPEACDLLKAMGDDLVNAVVINEKGDVVLRCCPTGMFGPCIEGIEDMAEYAE